MVFFADMSEMTPNDDLKKLKATDKLVLFYHEDQSIPVSLHAQLCGLKAPTEYIVAESDAEKAFYIGAYCGLKKPLAATFLTEFQIPEAFKPSSAQVSKPRKKATTSQGQENKSPKKEVPKEPQVQAEAKAPTKKKSSENNKETKVVAKVSSTPVNTTNEGASDFEKMLHISGSEFDPKWSDDMAYSFLKSAFKDSVGKSKEMLIGRLLEDFSENDVVLIMKRAGSNVKKLETLASKEA